jgi:hypothetical protein
MPAAMPSSMAHRMAADDFTAATAARCSSGVVASGG